MTAKCAALKALTTNKREHKESEITMANKGPEFDTKIITPTFRLSYPHVWKATFNQLAKREEFSIQMLFDKKTDKTALQPMVALVNKMKEWKGWSKAVGIRSPFIDGDGVNAKGEPWVVKNPSVAGMIFVRSWSKNQPGIVDLTGKHPITQEDEIYGGCYCRAQVNAYAYDQAGQKGINFGLVHIQKIKDGQPFGNRTKAEDAFAPVEGEVSTADDNSMFG